MIKSLKAVPTLVAVVPIVVAKWQASIRARRLGRYIKAQDQLIKRLVPKIMSKTRGGDIHQLRVATRRANAVLWILKHSSAKFRLKKLRRRLKKLQASLGRYREMDVAFRDAKHYEIDRSNLKAKRTRVEKSLLKSLRSFETLKIGNEMVAVEDQLGDSSDRCFDQALCELHDHLVLCSSKKLKKSELHRLRIEIKRTRYVLEAFGKSVKPLSELQTVLGKVHDLEILEKWTGPNLKAKRDGELFLRKGVRLVRPTVRFTLAQLKTIGGQTR